jgi:hypothetical protein
MVADYRAISTLCEEVRRYVLLRRTDDGRLELPSLQLELRFLLTVWARGAGTRQAISDWMMRLIKDHLATPAAVLKIARHNAIESLQAEQNPNDPG